MLATPVIIDIEASGFGAGSYPIEVGYADRTGQTWCSLITPSEDWTHWNASAEKLHHITRDTLLAHGRSIDVVATRLNQVFLNQTLYSDGWLHDFTWLNVLFEEANMQPHFKLQDLRAILTPYQQSVWHAKKQSILNELGATRHRASADAKVLQMTWLKTREDESHAFA